MEKKLQKITVFRSVRSAMVPLEKAFFTSLSVAVVNSATLFCFYLKTFACWFDSLGWVDSCLTPAQNAVRRAWIHPQNTCFRATGNLLRKWYCSRKASTSIYGTDLFNMVMSAGSFRDRTLRRMVSVLVTGSILQYVMLLRVRCYSVWFAVSSEPKWSCAWGKIAFGASLHLQSVKASSGILSHVFL